MSSTHPMLQHMFAYTYLYLYLCSMQRWLDAHSNNNIAAIMIIIFCIIYHTQHYCHIYQPKYPLLSACDQVPPLTASVTITITITVTVTVTAAASADAAVATEPHHR